MQISISRSSTSLFLPLTASHTIRRYISDIGAHQLQPLFIAMGTVTVVSFTTVFVTERWLRHRGTIARNTSLFQKVLSGLAILFAIIGMIGLIILTCRNNIKYSKTHDACLVVFMSVPLILQPPLPQLRTDNMQCRLHSIRHLRLLGIPTSRNSLPSTPNPPHLILDQTYLHLR